MAVPPNAAQLTRPMDPSDIRDFTITISQGADDASMLMPGESVASYTLAVTAEAAAAGLQIKTGGGYVTSISGRVIHFWLAIDPTLQASAAFDGAGLTLGIELTVTTDATPPRVYQRTVTIKVANQ